MEVGSNTTRWREPLCVLGWSCMRESVTIKAKPAQNSSCSRCYNCYGFSSTKVPDILWSNNQAIEVTQKSDQTRNQPAGTKEQAKQLPFVSLSSTGARRCGSTRFGCQVTSLGGQAGSKSAVSRKQRQTNSATSAV